MKKTLFVFALFVASVSSCKHEILNPGGIDPNTTGNGTGHNGAICFETDVLPIFVSSCAKSGCHDASSHREGYQLDTWANITKRGITAGNASASKVYQSLFGGGENRMPQPPNPALSDAQKKTIAQWINEGATNTTGCAATCDTSSYLYTRDVLPILQNNCVGCHNNSLANGGVNFSTYTGTSANADRISNAIQWKNSNASQNMPQDRKMSDCDITIILKWINAGHQNN
jgi:cytochrome c551/c552